MNVISKISNKSLIKNSIYEVMLIRNLNTENNMYFYPIILLKLNNNICKKFKITDNKFTSVDGSPLPNINWESPSMSDIPLYSDDYIHKGNTVKIGDYVRYTLTLSKILIKNNIYRIADVKTTTRLSKTNYKSEIIFIKIEGYDKWLNTSSFVKLNKQNTRNINLNVLLDDEINVKPVNNNIRIIETFNDKEKENIIIECLLKSYLDKKRNNMDIIEWAINKTGYIYSLIKSDFEPYLNKTLKSFILKI